MSGNASPARLLPARRDPPADLRQHEELTDRAEADPDVARLLMAGGGLRGEHVPWLVRAGVRQFQVEEAVRPGGTWRSHVEAGHVRAWRMLLDDATDRAAGRPTG